MSPVRRCYPVKTELGTAYRAHDLIDAVLSGQLREGVRRVAQLQRRGRERREEDLLLEQQAKPFPTTGRRGGREARTPAAPVWADTAPVGYVAPRFPPDVVPAPASVKYAAAPIEHAAKYSVPVAVGPSDCLAKKNGHAVVAAVLDRSLLSLLLIHTRACCGELFPQLLLQVG